MRYVIENDRGDFYGGFDENGPVWLRTRQKVTQLDEQTADLVLRQLDYLGYRGLTKSVFH